MSIDTPVEGAAPAGPVTVTGTAVLGAGAGAPAEIDSLYLNDRNGTPSPITDVTPSLPQEGPVTVNYTATTDDPVPAGGQVCVTAYGSDSGGPGEATDCHTVTVTEPPQVDAGGPYAGQEGAPVEIAGSAVDTAGAPLEWSYATVDADPGTECDFADRTAAETTVTCTDDGAIDLTLTADDGADPPTSDTARLTLSNVGPEVQSTEPDDGTIDTGQPVEFEVAFTDPGSSDTHSCMVDFGDGTVADGAVDQSPGSGVCHVSHEFSEGGPYDVLVTVTDDDGGATTAAVRLTAAPAPVLRAGEAFAIEGHGLLTIPKSPHVTCPPDESLSHPALNTPFADVSGLHAECAADSQTGETVATASVDRASLFGGVVTITDFESTCVSNSDGMTGSSRIGTINGFPIGTGSGSISITPVIKVHYNETTTNADGQLVQNAIRVQTRFGQQIILAGCRLG